MQKCHICGGNLDQAAIGGGKCPLCGAVVRKLPQRTIEDKRSPRGHGADTDSATIESAESFDLDVVEDQAAPQTYEPQTYELSQSDTAGEDGGRPASEPDSPDRKSPTIGDASDMTLEFQPTPEAPDDGEEKPTRRSTHTFESDRTIDIDMSGEEARNVDLQWRGTFDRDAKLGQTIRQKETITGFRSSLPVKSRHIREKRKKGPVTPPKSPSEVPDYELLDIIGEGGMGVVYAAHQSSIARTVAVKMLKPSAKVREEQRDKFISEAVVTGELDHPNIVPIYDLGANDEGALFYSMKRVRGTPWDKVIHQKQLDENLSILLRVADAVAFAHAGGVIHRDLKPENVMLGDFGEVLVMDWGLARITPEFAHADAVYQADSLGGTPAYMSPEMAKGPVEKINKTSDIYLLGAILYEIIGGQPPHSGRDVMQCLMAASQNRIDPIRYDGELKEIALRAMATRQEDRYPSVKDFQAAVRTYLSHSESLVLTAHANQNLQKARSSGDYQLFARALYGFQESLTLWNENHRARTLLAETQRDYAKCALDKGDLDLAASLLDENNAEHRPLREQITAAQAERDARQRRLRLAKRTVAALVALVVVTVTVAYFQVSAARDAAVVARDDALLAQKQEEAARLKEQDARAKEAEARGLAEKRHREAEEARAKEEIARKDEEEQRKLAQAAEKAALEAKEREEYEAYIAQIGLAAAKINENAFGYAQQLLADSKPELRNWEWGRLSHLSHLSAGSYEASAPVYAVAYSPDGRTFAAGDLNGGVTVGDVVTGRPIYSATHGQYVLAVAYSPDGRYLATGSSDGKIRIADVSEAGLQLQDNLVATLEGHTDGVLTVRFSPDGRQLLSGSYDNTARLWDLRTRRTLQQFREHSWWVWAAEFSPDMQQIVTAGQDGKAVVWQREADNYATLTEFTGHEGAVYSAAFSPDGQLVATGGYDKLVMIWQTNEVEPVDIGKRLDGEPDPPASHLQLAGHDGPVRSVTFSPNGELVLSGSEDNTLRVWEAADGKPLKALRGHGGIVRCVAFSPDGQQVISGGDDQQVRLWDVQGYEEVRVLHARVFKGHEDAVLAARFSQDGRYIVTASRDRTASLWDARIGQPLKRFDEGHEFLVSGAAFFPDGEHLATGAGDNTVRIWEVVTGTEKLVLTPTGRIGALAISPDGQWIATGSMGTDVQIWNAHTGERVAKLSGHSAEVSALAFAPSSDRLASGGNGRRVRLWRLERGADGAAWSFERELVGHSGAITGLRFTPDGRRLVTASADRSCGQWDVETGEEFRQLVLRHPEWVTSLDLSPDGALALTTCDDGHARLWRLADGALLAAVQTPSRPFNMGAFSADGSTAVLTSAEDKRVRLWEVSAAAGAATPDAVGAQSADLLLDFNTIGGEVWAAIFAPRGREVLTIGGNDAQLWSIEERRPMVRYSPHGAVASAAISPDGRLVATGSWDHSAKIWDTATGRAIRKLDHGHTAYINSVEFSPDARELLTASDDYTARLWDVESGTLKDVAFVGHVGRVLAATYSPDATRVLTVSGDKTARIWDRSTGELLLTLDGHAWAVLAGQFSPDGSRVITGSEDKSAKIWDTRTGDELLSLEGHSAAVTSVAISPDGTRVLTGSQDDTAKLWDAHTGKEILSLAGHTQAVTSVGFSRNGRDVLTSSRDGRAIIWLAEEWRDAAAKVAGTEPSQ